MNTKRVLLTGGRAPGTLELARLLTKQGHVVQIAESFRFSLSRKSKCVEKFHVIREPKHYPALFIKDLIAIAKQEKIDWLLPTCEEIFYIAQHQEELTPYCHVFVDDFDKLISLHNKFTFIEQARNWGLTVPETMLVSDKKVWDRLTLSSDKTFVAKQAYSRFSTNVHIFSGEEKPSLLFSEENPWILQDFIEGEIYCSYGVARKGVLLASAVYKSEFRAGEGASIYFEEQHHEAITNWVKTFVEKTAFTGQIAFDFIGDKESIYAIECNPRLTSGVHLFRENNLSEAFFEEPTSVITPTAHYAVSLVLPMLLYAPKNMRRVGFRRFIEAMKKTKDVVYTKGDSLPFWYQLTSFYHFFLISKKQKISLLEATTYDISWDGGNT